MDRVYNVGDEDVYDVGDEDGNECRVFLYVIKVNHIANRRRCTGSRYNLDRLEVIADQFQSFGSSATFRR